MNAKIALIGFLAEKARFSRRCAHVVIAGLIDKIGDIKSGSKVKESLTSIAEACSLGHVAGEVSERYSYAAPVRALARISELGVQKYTFGVNLVSSYFYPIALNTQKYRY